jgi:hypothetical protein
MKIAFGVSGAARPDGNGEPQRKEVMGRLGDAKGG